MSTTDQPIVMLQWEFFRDEGRWECFSGIHDDGNPFRWIIRVQADGTFDINESDDELIAGKPESFPKLTSAKAWCEGVESAAQFLNTGRTT